jgi:hypothetical protein
MLARAFAHHSLAGVEARGRVCGRQRPGRESQVDAVFPRQIRERQRRDLVFNVAHPLSQRRFGHAGRAYRPRLYHARRLTVVRQARGEAWQYLFHQEPAHLARHAGQQHHHAPLGILEPQPGRRPARIGEHAGTLRHLRLGAVDLGHRTSEAPEARFELAQHGLVELQGPPEQLRRDDLGHVVARGPQAAGGDNEPGAVERFREGRPNGGRAVGD